jgi:hypothetical protein
MERFKKWEAEGGEMKDAVFYILLAMYVFKMGMTEYRVRSNYRAGLLRGYMRGYDDAKDGKPPRTPEE